MLNLGVATDLDLVLSTADVALEGITVSAERGGVISSERTGAATTVAREAIAALPNVSGRLDAVARLSPQSGGGLSFAGQDNRMNNITVDGSCFNNSFGLGGQPGDRTGVAPISLEAIEQVQVNVAPFDVRQGNFVGAGVNSVTRSGTNELRGSIYSPVPQPGAGRHRGRGSDGQPGHVHFSNTGGWVAGPIVQEQAVLLRELRGRSDERSRARPSAPTAAASRSAAGHPRARVGSSTRCSSLPRAPSSTTTPAPYEGYNSETPAKRFLAKSTTTSTTEQGQLPLQPSGFEHRRARCRTLLARVRQPANSTQLR